MYPVIDSDTANQLDSPLSLEEVSNSIKAMQSNKAPGPDRFPIEFFWNIDWKIGTATLIRVQQIPGNWYSTTNLDSSHYSSPSWKR